MNVNVSLDNFLQLLVNGIISGSTYALLGVAFGIILSVTGRFHFAFAFTYALAAFTAARVGTNFNATFWTAMIAGALVAAVVGALIELFFYRPLARRAGAAALLTIFVTSLGISIVGENLLSIKFPDSASGIIPGLTVTGIEVGPVNYTSLDVQAVVVAWALIVALTLVVRYTNFGRMVRAVRSNPDMGLVVGVNPRTIFLIVFAIGSFLGGIAAFYDAAHTAATPTMGFQPIFYAFTVAFVAGPTRPPVVVGAIGLGLGLIQSLSGLFLSSTYADLVVFGLLFIYVSFRSVDLRALMSRGKPIAAA